MFALPLIRGVTPSDTDGQGIKSLFSMLLRTLLPHLIGFAWIQRQEQEAHLRWHIAPVSQSIGEGFLFGSNGATDLAAPWRFAEENDYFLSISQRFKSRSSIMGYS